MKTDARPSSKLSDWEKVWPKTSLLVVNELQDEAVPEYVGWIDLMGAKGWMAGSIRHAAELVGLIHIAAHAAVKSTNARVYPVIDGVYITSPDKAEFKAATHQTLRTLARTFEARKKIDRFLVRGGVAYGRLLHGRAIAKLHSELSGNAGYTNCLAIGAAIRQAYLAESSAPPFGLYVDMTARSIASGSESPYNSSFDRWWRADTPKQKEIATRFGILVDDHLGYLSNKRREIEYPEDRLKEHRALAREYFRLPLKREAS